MAHVVGVTTTIPHPVSQFEHSVAVGHTVVVVGLTFMLVHPQARVRAAVEMGHDQPGGTHRPTRIQGF